MGPLAEVHRGGAQLRCLGGGLFCLVIFHTGTESADLLQCINAEESTLDILKVRLTFWTALEKESILEVFKFVVVQLFSQHRSSIKLLELF